jgi:hypothetical protein
MRPKRGAVLTKRGAEVGRETRFGRAERSTVARSDGLLSGAGQPPKRLRLIGQDGLCTKNSGKIADLRISPSRVTIGPAGP